MSRRFDVALLGYYGFGNLGDDLLLEAFLGLLREAGVPEDHVIVFSAKPEETRSLCSVQSADRWSPASLWATLRRSETLLYGGGGLFQDATSVRSAVYYASVAHLARMAGCAPWSFGQSFGPFRTKTGEALSRSAVRRMLFRGVRDGRSLEILKSWGLSGTLTPDAVFSLASEETGSGKRGGVLLVNLRPWPGDLTVRAAAEAGRLSEEAGIPLVGVAMSDADEILLRSLSDGGTLPCAEIRRPVGLQDARRLWSDAAASFGMRLHFCVLSALFGVSCTAVPYDPKVAGFAQDIGMPCFPETRTGGRRPERTARELGGQVRSEFLNAWRDLRDGNMSHSRI